MATQLKGIVRASNRNPEFRGKQFLGVTIECSDGKTWVIDYHEESPFREFADREVLVIGEPYKPEGQHQSKTAL